MILYFDESQIPVGTEANRSPVAGLSTEHSGKSDEQLAAAGIRKFEIPDLVNHRSGIDMEEYDYLTWTHGYKWNVGIGSFEITELPEEQRVKLIDFKAFWEYISIGKYDHQNDQLVTNTIYQTIRNASKTDLPTNVAVTEFISEILNARIGYPNISRIQSSLNEILSLVTLSSDDLTKLQSYMTETGVSTIINLPS